MENFDGIFNGQQSENGLDLVKLMTALSQKFDGKSQNDLLRAVYEEAEKGKRNGTLPNEQLDYFENMLSVVLDDKKRKLLKRIIKELKKI